MKVAGAAATILTRVCIAARHACPAAEFAAALAYRSSLLLAVAVWAVSHAALHGQTPPSSTPQAAAGSPSCSDPTARTLAEPLQVALVSGANSAGNQSDDALALLKAQLEEHYPMECVLITERQGGGLSGIEALEDADTAVFFVHNLALPERDMIVVRRFFDSGKGFVALRTTSHGWENWPTFDVDTLGAKYEGEFDPHGPIDYTYMHPHPIFTGARDFQTQQSMYQFGELADDVHVIMQSRNAHGTAPTAWTRENDGSRAFHLIPGRVEDFENAAYLRIVANGIFWVTHREIAGAETAVVRTIMPDSYPGSLAVVFPQGPSFCFDPVRGGINYIWDSTFIDFRPTWTGKVGQEATIRGTRFYQETGEPPLRQGDVRHEPQVQFKGYQLHGGYPVFSYRIDDCLVREKVKPLPDGCGVVREFRTEAPGETFWLLTGDQDAAVCAADRGQWENGRLRITADAEGAFRVTIQQKPTGITQ